jgi:hypothetical protein
LIHFLIFSSVLKFTSFCYGLWIREPVFCFNIETQCCLCYACMFTI